MLFRASAKLTCRLPVFILILSLYFTLILNLPFMAKSYYHFAEASMATPAVHLVLPALSLLFFFISAFSLLSVRALQKPMMIFLILISTILNYLYLYYGLVFEKSSEIIGTITQANWDEISLFITPSFLLYFVVIGILPCILIYKTTLVYPEQKQTTYFKLLGISIYPIFYLLVSLPTNAAYSPLFKKSGMTGKSYYQIIPSNFFENVFVYYYDSLFLTHRYIRIGMDAKSMGAIRDKKDLLVLVVGETARGMNFELNGYLRDTNQYTKNHNIFSFHQVSACGTCTQVSVPCMFSSLPRKEFQNAEASHQDNLLDILQRANLNVLWIDNNGNGNCQGVCKNIESIIANKQYDGMLKDELEKNLKHMSQRNSVIVLHLKGSHGMNYHEKYPSAFGRYTPACVSNELRSCSAVEIINAYDNSILYTDYVINELIETLKKQKSFKSTALIYVSDHGESLGEAGIYEHCAPYKIAPREQTQVPLMFWASRSFMKHKHINAACLKKMERAAGLSHDNLFHTVLGLMEVSTSVYQQKLDMFKSCRV